MVPTDKPESVRVTCPTCHERLEATLEEAPQALDCPFCGGSVAIPSRDRADRERGRTAVVPAPPVDDYPVVLPPELADTATAGPGAEGEIPPSPPSTPVSSKAAEEATNYVTVACATCNERMRVAVGPKPSRVGCTFCQTPVYVPDIVAVQQWRRRKLKTAPAEAIGDYATGVAHKPPPLPMHLFDKLAEIRSEPPVPPPKWLFFSGVFGFPWRKETVFRWGAMTIGFTIILMIVGLFVSNGTQTGPGGVGIIGLGFFGLPLIWLSIWTFSFSADCAVRVLESTASGLDHVEAWSEGGWKEWVPHALYLGWIGSIPALVGYVAGLIAQRLDAPFWPVTLAAVFVLYPIALLSALDANSVWVPLTKVVFKSLLVLWWGWIGFYLLTALIAAGLGALLYYGVPRLEVFAFLAVAPLLSASLLIYARLLGRLAWKIGQKVSA